MNSAHAVDLHDKRGKGGLLLWRRVAPDGDYEPCVTRRLRRVKSSGPRSCQR